MTQTRPPLPTARRSGGFTLIEVLIVVAIVGILVAVAYPAYGQYVTNTRRADAHFSLLSARQAMERCRSTTYTYENCSIAAHAASEEGFYTLALKGTTTSSTFEIEATAVGAQASDSACPKLTINHLDEPEPAACW